MKLVDPNLENTYIAIKGKKKREAAEIAYALGLICKRSGDLEGMRKYREESIALFKEIKVNSLKEASPVYFSINEVILPELIHEDVVARDLADK